MDDSELVRETQRSRGAVQECRGGCSFPPLRLCSSASGLSLERKLYIRVLAVSRDHHVQKLISNAMGDQGNQVWVAVNGKEAFELATRHDFDLAFVCELKHTMQRLAELSNCMIRVDDLPPEIVSAPTVTSIMNRIIPEGALPTLEQIGSSYLLRVLSAVGGNKACASFGI